MADKEARKAEQAVLREQAEKLKQEAKRDLTWGRTMAILGIVFILGGFMWMSTKNDNSWLVVLSGAALFMMGCKMISSGRGKANGKTKTSA